MRRVTLMIMALAMALVSGSGVALAALVEGDNGDNTLTGTPRADTIRAFAGEDVVWGFSGRDQIFGGNGADELYGNSYGDRISGGGGEDHLYGGYGDDHIASRDLNGRGIGQRDLVDCGPGYDTFAADFEDQVLENCEEGSVGGF